METEYVVGIDVIFTVCLTLVACVWIVSFYWAKSRERRSDKSAPPEEKK